MGAVTATPWYQGSFRGSVSRDASPSGRQPEEIERLDEPGQPSCATTSGLNSDWYGAHPHWVLPLQAAARRQFGAQLRSQLLPGQLIYALQDLPVRGRREPTTVTVRFYAQPPYETYGLAPQDFPRVHADRGQASPHRMPHDDALCLYYPLDPLEQRWHAQLGLLSLFGVIADHLFCEEYWRSTGAWSGGQWPGQEAPHGFPSTSSRGITTGRRR